MIEKVGAQKIDLRSPCFQRVRGTNAQKIELRSPCQN
jgi:hypothetical protein